MCRLKHCDTLADTLEKVVRKILYNRLGDIGTNALVDAVFDAYRNGRQENWSHSV